MQDVKTLRKSSLPSMRAWLGGSTSGDGAVPAIREGEMEGGRMRWREAEGED
jgi:hypothetical protein